MGDNIGWAGAPELSESDTNDAAFIVQQVLAHARQATIVKVLKVYPGTWSSQDNGTPDTIDVQPMIDQVNSQGTRQEHGTIYGVLCSRHHAGGNVVRNTPVVGDVGFMTVGDRDHSQLVENKGAQSAPGSNRRYSLSDGVYWGGIFTPKPNNTIDVSGGNVVVTTEGNVTATTSGDGKNISATTTGANSSINHLATGANSTITHVVQGPNSTINMQATGTNSTINMQAPTMNLS